MLDHALDEEQGHHPYERHQVVAHQTPQHHPVLGIVRPGTDPAEDEERGQVPQDAENVDGTDDDEGVSELALLVDGRAAPGVVVAADPREVDAGGREVGRAARLRYRVPDVCHVFHEAHRRFGESTVKGRPSQG